MREARIIVPATPMLTHIEDELVRQFGGFTRTEGVGAWKPDTTSAVEYDDVYIFDIALPMMLGPQRAIREFAEWVRQITGEKAIYVRYQNGEVDLVQERIKCSEGEDIGSWVA